jgi:hypothetical protein
MTALGHTRKFVRRSDYSCNLCLKWKVIYEELRNLYPSPDIIRMITSRSIRRMERVAHEGYEICEKFWLESLKG